MSRVTLLCTFSAVICMVYGLPKPLTDGKDGKYDFPFVPRSEWSPEPKPEYSRLLNTPVSYVVAHHTYIPGACNSSQECIQAMISMQKYHASLGWEDIGYNFCVGGDGTVYEGRGWYVTGTHAGRANSVSIGICLIGDWRDELPPQKQLETTKALIAAGVDLGVISQEYKLVGHRQMTNTECPGGALFGEIGSWDHYSPHPTGPLEPLENKPS